VKPQEVEALTKHTKYMHIKYITPKVWIIKKITWPEKHENIIIFRSFLQAWSEIVTATDVNSGSSNGLITVKWDSREEVIQIANDFMAGILIEYEAS
jgi:hypothetical protein